MNNEFCTFVLRVLPATGHPDPKPEYDENGKDLPPKSFYTCGRLKPCPVHSKEKK